MAQSEDRHPLNQPGSFFNDDTCIDCGLCPEIAPGVFRRDDRTAQSYVWHQPETPEEAELAREALHSCPTESIGEI